MANSTNKTTLGISIDKEIKNIIKKTENYKNQKLLDFAIDTAKDHDIGNAKPKVFWIDLDMVFDGLVSKLKELKQGKFLKSVFAKHPFAFALLKEINDSFDSDEYKED